MTQEELAEALFVSRTAISKWESGRGYPNIDSLKEISRYFSVSIDDLISSDDLIVVAENEKKEFAGRYISLICSVMDIFMAILLFIPAFGNGKGASGTVALFGLSGVNPWVKAVFAVIVGILVINGIMGLIVANLERPVWNDRLLAAGTVASVLAVIVFMAARQPYAGIVSFSLLVIKVFLRRKNNEYK